MLRALFGSKPRSANSKLGKKPSKVARRRSFFETLEERRVLTTGVMFAAGVLTFTSDGDSDTVLLQSTATPDTVQYNAGGLGLTSQAGVTQVVFNGNGGNDLLVVANPGGNIFAPTNGIVFNGGGQAGDELDLVGGAANWTGIYNVASPTTGKISYTNGVNTQMVSYTGTPFVRDSMTAASLTTNTSALGDTINVNKGPVLGGIASISQGPAVIDGGDRDDHGHFSMGENQDGWLFIEQGLTFLNQTVFNSGAANSILAVGVTGGQALAALNSAASEAGLNVTVVTGAAINSVNFNSYRILYVPSDANDTSGGITNADLDRLEARKSDITAFVNNGGGLYALTEGAVSPISKAYAWLAIPNQFTLTSFGGGGISQPLRKTPAAIAAGFTITDTELSNGVPYHNVFTGPVGFNNLDVFVLDLGPDNILGNADDRAVTLGHAAIQSPGLGGDGPSTDITFDGDFTPIRVNGKAALHFNSLAGDDVLNVFYTMGNPVPNGVGITYNGGGDTDAAAVIGTAANTASYTPSGSGSGTLTMNDGAVPYTGTVVFTNTEGADISGTSEVTVQLPGSNDLAIATASVDFAAGGVNPAERIGGSLGATPFTPVALYGNPIVKIDGAGGADTLRVASLLAGFAPGSFQLLGQGGNDTFQLFDGGNQVSGILSQVRVQGGAGNDALVVNGSGDGGAHSVFITEQKLWGLTGFAGSSATPDVDYSTPGDIESFNITTTGGSDTIDVQLQSGSQITTGTVNGAGSSDQFYVDLGTAGDPENAVSGLATLFLNGDAGNDIFGETPSNLPVPPPPAALPPPVFPLGKGKIQLSTTTAITINGGNPPAASADPISGNANNGNEATGDRLNLDVTDNRPVAISDLSVAIIDTVGGTATVTGFVDLNFGGIEIITACDQGLLTRVEMGDLYARLTEFNDTLTTTRAGNSANPDRILLRINGAARLNHYYTKPLNMIVYARAGNDSISLANVTCRAEFYGEEGDDFLTGSIGSDLLVGGLGSDRINANGGNNEVWGDELGMQNDNAPMGDVGNDILSAGNGNDIFYGGWGDDTISASTGDDYLYGGTGNDVLTGGGGDDRLYGGSGNDNLNGQNGNDLLSGGWGNDLIQGGMGNDVIFGGQGRDTISGQSGFDLIVTDQVMNETGSTANVGNDAALLIFLNNWASTQTIGAITTTDDADEDHFQSGTGEADRLRISATDRNDETGKFGLLSSGDSAF